MKNKLRAAIVLDKSGSMFPTSKKTLMGCNEQIQQLKLNKDVEVLLSFVSFNGEVDEHFWDKPIAEVPELTEADYNCVGSTAMQDALGYTINKLLSSKDDVDTTHLVICISDGETNQDKVFSVKALRELIEGCQKNDNWTFTYMGCSMEYLEEVAKKTAIPIANMAAWKNDTEEGVLNAFDGLKGKLGSYCSAMSARGVMGSSAGKFASKNFMSDVDGQAEDYTKDKKETK